VDTVFAELPLSIHHVVGECGGAWLARPLWRFVFVNHLITYSLGNLMVSGLLFSQDGRPDGETACKCVAYATGYDQLNSPPGSDFVEAVAPFDVTGQVRTSSAAGPSSECEAFRQPILAKVKQLAVRIHEDLAAGQQERAPMYCCRTKKDGWQLRLCVEAASHQMP
jgi:hypothetical protein